MSRPARVRGPVTRLAAGLLTTALLAASLVATDTAAAATRSPPTFAQLRAGTTSYTLIQAQSHLALGTDRFVFALADAHGDLLAGGTPQVWTATTPRAPAIGPARATWRTWTATHDDPTGTPPVNGYYATDLTSTTAGTLQVLATARVHGRRISATGTIPVRAHPPAALGTPAISEPTPVATTPEAAAAIDTRDPPTPMHYLSLDAALRNGLPTVLIFATPLLCTSRMCGPVVDEALDVFNHVGPQRANFVDVEIYPDRNPNQPTPVFLRWGFDSEPWVLVIDRTGIIRARFEGPVVAPEIDAALTPLLASPQ
jgi:hypothetical protein